MEEISRSVVKKDSADKVSGRSVYVGDYEKDGVLTGKLLRSRWARAGIKSVKLPELPEGYHYIDRSDVPGENRVHIVLDDTPVFAGDTVEYIGEPIGMVCGPDEAVCEDILRRAKVEAVELEPVLDVRKADTVFFEYGYEKGDVEKAFREADKVFEETFSTGHQEQAYLEPQGIMAEPEADGGVFVHGSMQCIYYVHGALQPALGCGPDGVHVMQDVTGGGFGGKEDYPSILGCQVAVAAKKTGKPVRCVLDRREDMEFTPKRHPSLSTYRVAVKDGKITAMDADIQTDAGAYTTLSAVVLQRAVICASGVYRLENLRVHGRALKTNTVPGGAYRGFGAPQAFFAVEMMMDHVAANLGVDSLAFREAHLVRQGDATSTSGAYHFPVPLPAMIEKLDAACDYRKKRRAYAAPQAGRYRRGIGLSLCYHGAGFTGSGERDHIKAVVRLLKRADGTVEVLAANGDIGQGLRTTFPKIVAHELGLPLENVVFDLPDTARVPDSGPTVASRSLMVVGELLRRAAVRLRESWVDGEEQMIEERYRHPDYLIPFDLEKFRGDAYPTYAWSVSAVEVETDSYTGLVKILGAYGCFDVGTPADEAIVIGQMEGGYLQGLGYASIEHMNYDARGRIRNNSFSDYLIPTSADVPRLQCCLYVDEYPDGPYGGKGAGELPLVGAAPAYAAAVEQSMGARLRHIPVAAEDVLTAREGM